MSTLFHEREISPPSTRRPRYVVVFKTYLWDSFIERQAQRWAAGAYHGDFFISADETRGPLGSMPFDRVVRSTNADLIASGLADRAERGSLLWWNADYVHYHFFNLHPSYDLYFFVEYDSLFLGDLDRLAQQLWDDQIDLAALPMKESLESWPWTGPHLQTYSQADLGGCLICISVLSHRALRHLRDRRQEMSRDPEVVFWPSAEAFLPTEIKRSGLRFGSLDDYGDTASYTWRPPQLEAETQAHPEPAFVHPVYDQRRYLSWVIERGDTLRESLDPTGFVWTTLARFPLRTYFPALAKRVIKNVIGTLTYRLGLSRL